MSAKADAKRRLSRLNILIDGWKKVSPETKQKIYHEAPGLHFAMVVLTSEKNRKLL
jgi:hypothetical protein